MKDLFERLEKPPKFSGKKAINFGKPKKVKKSFKAEGLKL
jgi:hypothetical protein